MNAGIQKKHVKQFYRPDELAKLFDVDKKTVYRILADGELAYLKIRGVIRVPARAVIAYIEQKLDEFAEETGSDVPTCGLASLEPLLNRDNKENKHKKERADF